jgi:ubiquinone biosynthesis protein UbiJ
MAILSGSATLKAGLLLALERTINSSLSYAPTARSALHALDGSVLQVLCTAPAQSVYVLFLGEHVELWSLYEGAPDATLSGTASAFLALWRARNKVTALSDSGVTLAGNSALLQQLQKIASELDIDWEALLAEHAGDVVAHQLGRVARHGQRWLLGVRREAERLASEFLQFESHTVPSKHEVAGFCREVDDLQLRVDRLQAGIAVAMQQRAQRGD